ncbi:MAG: NADP-dependent oxidoreductase [Nitrospirae bacterium]|nr:NADP-dependent oxidoreductase [Candidatus Manganitrophaceae bacterium]
MRAIAVDRFGDTPTLHDLPRPEPGEGEVLIAVRAAGVNPFDWKVIQAPMGDHFKYHFPFILGVDTAGVVERVGPGVNDLKVGEALFGMIRKPVFGEGTYAEYVTAPASVVAKKPASLTFEQAAAVPMPALTALTSVDTLQIGEGETLLIVGATGGVGSYAVQLAARRGAHVIATALTEDAEYMRDLGASETIDYRSTDLVEAVKGAHPDGIDALLDLVSDAEKFNRIAATLKKGGRLATTLYVADEEAFAAQGITAANIANQPSRPLLERLVQMIDAGKLTVPLQKIFPLEQAPAAIEQSRSGHVRGKRVLKIA